jgi:excisionase family DNA binding protein
MTDFEKSFQQLIDSAVEKAFLKHIDKMNHHNSYLTVSEAAEQLKISPQQVHNLINNHELPHKRFGKRVIRIPENEFEEWQENRK